MEVADAKEAFLSWNKKNFEYFISQLEPEQESALKLLPLLLQTNNRILPGYNGPNTPAGIYGYTPESSIVKEVKKAYAKFSFDQTVPLKNAIIESVFLQQDILAGKLTLWLIHAENLKHDQREALENKIIRIRTWLKSRDLYIDYKLITAKRLSKKSKPAAVFLDDFYYEAFLLAGKYPVWWLVPPDKETNYSEFVEHIKSVRFVNENEFIDLGSLQGMGAGDILKLAINYAKNYLERLKLNVLYLYR